MKIYLGSDHYGTAYKLEIIKLLTEKNITVIDMSETEDIFDVTEAVVGKILEDPTVNRGIIVDRYGVAPFMFGSKFKGIICSETNDEHSAMMTRDHNNANLITMGSGIVGIDVCLSIVERFVTGEYSGGRHQIRIDMLDRMGS